jgi:hypothetical protein
MVVARLDENDDERLDQTEAQGSFLAAQFSEVDANGDGVIERKELQTCACPAEGHEKTASESREARTARQQSDREGGSRRESGESEQSDEARRSDESER